jgi:hypothetical protein
VTATVLRIFIVLSSGLVDGSLTGAGTAGSHRSSRGDPEDGQVAGSLEDQAANVTSKT